MARRYVPTWRLVAESGSFRRARRSIHKPAMLAILAAAAPALHLQQVSVSRRSVLTSIAEVEAAAQCTLPQLDSV